MLTKCRVYTTLPDADLELARASYEGVLGFAPASITPGGVFETYDFPGFRCRDLHGRTGPVASAWFRDSESNHFGLAQLDAG